MTVNDMKKIWCQEVRKLNEENHKLWDRKCEIIEGTAKLSYSMTVDSIEDINKAINYNNGRIKWLLVSIEG